jgi:uncharacterized protein YecE (DUF72 family)
MLAEARVGTSGFSYREWVGTVYPPGLSEAQSLALYGTQLSAVEIQSRLPDQATLATWAEMVPPGFEFALKLPGRIDLRAGKGAARSIGALLDSAGPLQDRLGPILVQLPSSAAADRTALNDFLRAVPQGVRIALELRHPSWHTEAVLRVLSAHNAALVLADHGEGPPRLELTADFAYVRIRREDDSSEIWNQWAERLALLTRRAVDVYAFLKHDRRGLALERSRRLAMLLRAEDAQSAQQLLT